jgi:predicted Fe-Mo cluster-binding NifX family protein
VTIGCPIDFVLVQSHRTCSAATNTPNSVILQMAGAASISALQTQIVDISTAAQAGQEQAQADLADRRAALADSVAQAHHSGEISAESAIQQLVDVVCIDPIQPEEVQVLLELVVEVVSDSSEPLPASLHVRIAQAAQPCLAQSSGDHTTVRNLVS